ncbi:MAG: biopolymer transporter ExbD [Methyloceanibacter sp.]|uniref:biopolymer transporter ExbD n=1 Tax=Methyloceanibacter sp. TaxID=1965321 RepID=UPI003EE1E3EF
MAAGCQYGGALSKRRARRGYRVPMSEINVTPMVDVMLVLLIIFMVTAPLLTMGVDIGQNANLPEVALPQTEAGAVTPVQKALSITVDVDGKIFLEESEIEFEELVPKLTAISETFGTGQVWVRGDAATSYGDVAKVLVRIKEAGLPVTLLTDQIAQP